MTPNQTHLVAMHHIDCPWKPSSIEQREGRGIRQGNENKEVALLGETGNYVLAGRNGSRNGVFFTNLNQVMTGDKVKLIDKNKKVHLYEVSEMFVTDPYDNKVKEQGEKEILTLLTCAERGTKRYIVRCIPNEEGDGVG